MEMNSDRGMLFEAEDDDVFYAEIRRQILKITTEEEEVEEYNLGFNRVNPIITTHGVSIGSGYGFQSGSPFGSHFGSFEAHSIINGGSSSSSPPVWLVNLWKNGKGTGVFIPQVVRCRKNQRQGNCCLSDLTLSL